MSGTILDVVKLPCKDEASAMQLETTFKAIAADAVTKYNCLRYDVGRSEVDRTVVYLVENWDSMDDIEPYLTEAIMPNMDHYNTLLAEPFDPAKHVTRITLEE